MLLARANSCLREGIREGQSSPLLMTMSNYTYQEADVHPSSKTKQTMALIKSRSNQIDIITRPPFPNQTASLSINVSWIYFGRYRLSLSRIIIGSAGDLIMLRAAAMYQAKSETVSQSSTVSVNFDQHQSRIS